jgi:phosphatidylserine decarboxylase
MPLGVTSVKPWLQRIFGHEHLNFVLTNRIPRGLATRFMGWFSQIEQPLVRDASLAAWQLFANLELQDAAKTEWKSIHDCFTRQLRPGARPIDPDPAIVVSPCDGIVMSCGPIRGDTLIQAKGLSYTLAELLRDPDAERAHRDGHYVTLRLTSSMYHRFHAPYDCRIDQVTYVHGETWNTNPAAVARVDRLYCKNERVVLRTTLRAGGEHLTLVAVASILVASIRLHFLDLLLHLDRVGPNVIGCEAEAHKGEELGYFQHGSTIIVCAPSGFTLADMVREGRVIRVGQPLLRRS